MRFDPRSWARLERFANPEPQQRQFGEPRQDFDPGPPNDQDPANAAQLLDEQNREQCKQIWISQGRSEEEFETLWQEAVQMTHQAAMRRRAMDVDEFIGWVGSIAMAGVLPLATGVEIYNQYTKNDPPAQVRQAPQSDLDGLDTGIRGLQDGRRQRERQEYAPPTPEEQKWLECLTQRFNDIMKGKGKAADPDATCDSVMPDSLKNRSKPSSSKPSTSKPSTSKPSTSKPSTSKPSSSKSETLPPAPPGQSRT